MTDNVIPFPLKPHRGFHPIGWPWDVQCVDSDCASFMACMARNTAVDCDELRDFHRLVHIGQPFTKERILHCLRLRFGRWNAGWIEGCVEKFAAEEKANSKAEDHQL